MALTLATVREAVALHLESIAGIGHVHRYRRYVSTEADVAKVYFHQPSGWMHAWFVSLATTNGKVSERGTGFARAPIGGGNSGVGDTVTRYTLMIEGHYGHSDERATQITFEDLVDAVTLSFDRHGLVTTDVSAFWQSAAQVQQTNYIEIAGRHLMHYARLALTIQGKTTP